MATKRGEARVDKNGGPVEMNDELRIRGTKSGPGRFGRGHFL
jgi:hypothetical protein